MATKKHPYFVDTNQSWWDLVAIQFSGWMGVPVLASSLLILQKNSFWGAVLTIIVGNAILWFIRLGIISMSFKNRQSTLDLSREYLGNFGGYLISIILLVSTFAWYVAQTTIGGNALTHLLSIHENGQINQFVQMSVLLGIISTFLCMEGMTLLKKLSLFSFPFIVISFFVILFTIPNRIPNPSTQALSLSGLSLFLVTNLGVSSDLPTFFRHGQSWESSIKALTVIQMFNLLFGILSLYFGSLVISELEINEQIALGVDSAILRYALVVFIFFSVICANVANVYSASVGWEIVAPSALVGRKEYLILGLSLTILFILVSNLFSPEFLLVLTDGSLVNLCIILTLGHVISKTLKAPPSFYLQTAYLMAWILSSGLNAVQYFHKGDLPPLMLSLGVIVAVVSSALLFGRTRNL